MRKFYTLFFILFSFIKITAQQYTVNGDGSQVNCHCYILTPGATFQHGSVWNNYKIDLTNNFTFVFDVNLGCIDATGADGIAFVLQPISTSVGGTGNGLGFGGISPSIGITLDTYQNISPDNDPVYDHIAIQRNGDLNHLSSNNLAGPVAISSISNDVEDCANHSLKISWNAAAKQMDVYFDGVLRVSTVNDFVNTTFGGNPFVYWGFTGSTGLYYNLQKFCTSLTPSFHFSAAQKKCVNEPIQFIDSTISFAPVFKFYWNFGDGSPVDSVNLNPVHIYSTAGIYTVTQNVIGADGCQEINTQQVIIGSKPVAAFTYNDSCVNNNILFTSTSTATFGNINTWYWDFGNGSISTAGSQNVNYTSGGNKLIKLFVTTQEGCSSDTLIKSIFIYERPSVDFNFTDSVCLGYPTFFTGQTITSNAPVNAWVWNFGDTSGVINTQNSLHYFITPGHHNVLYGATSTGSAGCLGIIQKDVFVVDKPMAGFKKPVICQGSSVNFIDSSYTTDGVAITGWWWDLGNGQFSNQQNPVAIYSTYASLTIKHIVYNSHGCRSDTLVQTLLVQPKAVAKFGYTNPVCENVVVQFTDSSLVNGNTINQWNWIYSGSIFSTQQNPFKKFTSGIQTVKLIVNSSNGCASDSTSQTFMVNTKPDVTFSALNACRFSPINFTAINNTNAINIANYNWNFGDGNIANGNNIQHAFTANGTYLVSLFGISSAGCFSDTVNNNIVIYSTNAFAGNDTIAAAGQPVQLNASGGLNYEWIPATGLSNAFIGNPIAILNATQQYILKAFTPQGCITYDTVVIKIYKGPDIYLPNAFTPNGDGLNDIFKGIPVGIKDFKFLKIYNRWGQEIFSSSDYRMGWDGKWKGVIQENGVYVVMALGVDFNGNTISKRSTVILIK